MASPSFDCYLCGTTNPPTADFCEKCSGQLLKLGDSGSSEEAVDDPIGTFDFDGSEPGAPSAQSPTTKSGSKADPDDKARSAKKQLPKIHKSIEDQRLSDALGLTPEPSEPEPSKPDDGAPAAQTKPKKQPKLNPAENTAVARPQASAKDLPSGLGQGGMFSSDEGGEVGAAAWVIVGMLFLAVAWLGYFTLVRTPDRLTPESIGFVADTTTVPPTSTTEAPPPELVSSDAVDSAYSRTIVRIVPFACDGTRGDSNGDPLVGVAINENNVLVGPGLPAGTNAVRIVSRTGSTRSAILSQQDGMTIATSNSRSSRNLDIDDVGTEAMFYVSFDLDGGDANVSETPGDLGGEISVSDTGDVYEVTIGAITATAEQLNSVELLVEVDEDLVGRGSDTCPVAAGLVFQSPAADEAPDESEETSDE